MVSERTDWQRQAETRKQVRERLLRFVRDEQLRPGDRLPPSRYLAKTFGVSLSAVQAGTRVLVDEGLLSTRVGSGTFVRRLPVTRERIQVLLGFSLPSGAEVRSWHGRIASGLLAAASEVERPLTWLPTGVGNVESRLAAADVAVVLPQALHSCDWLSMFRKSGRPVLWYNAPSIRATTQFVSPDYYGASAAVARAFLAEGRRHFVLLTGAPLSRSVSAWQRYAGFVAALGNLLATGEATVRWERAAGMGCGEDSVERMANLLNDPRFCRPQGVYAFGDPLALLALRALRDCMGRSCPGDVSVVGGSGAGEVRGSGVHLTSVAQPYEEIGRVLVRDILKTVDGDGSEIPGSYIPCAIETGETTTLRENRILKAYKGGREFATLD